MRQVFEIRWVVQHFFRLILEVSEQYRMVLTGPSDHRRIFLGSAASAVCVFVVRSVLKELELELIQTQMAQKPMLRAEVGMRVRCANKASAE